MKKLSMSLDVNGDLSVKVKLIENELTIFLNLYIFCAQKPRTNTQLAFNRYFKRCTSTKFVPANITT